MKWNKIRNTKKCKEKLARFVTSVSHSNTWQHYLGDAHARTVQDHSSRSSQGSAERYSQQNETTVKFGRAAHFILQKRHHSSKLE